MTTSADALKASLIDRTAALIHQRLDPSEAPFAERFLRAYYGPVAPDDLLAQRPQDLLGAVLAVWSFGRQREPGAPKVRLYSPRLEEHGWQSRYTVLEAINDDMPFLVDSLSSLLVERDLPVDLVVHPVMPVVRDESGTLVEVLPPGSLTPEQAADEEYPARLESFIHIELERVESEERLRELESAALQVLEDVRAAVSDWRQMLARVDEILDSWNEAPPPLAESEIAEARYFLKWLRDDHFTFLGYRRCELVRRGERLVLKGLEDTSLGILKISDRAGGSSAGRSAVERLQLPLSAEVAEHVRRREALVVTKSDRRATVHRPVHMDYVGIRRFDAEGQVVGEDRFLGLFTSVAYSRPASAIPFLRRKVERVLERAGYNQKGHAGKALVHILDTYPRDELFQIDEDELLAIATGILQLQERQRVALFVREDPFGRFVSCVVFVPRDRFHTELRRRIGDILADAFEGEVSAHYVNLDDSPLARVRFLIQTRPGRLPHYDRKVIEQHLAAAARSWPDRLRDVLEERFSPQEAAAIHRRYREAFSVAYRESFPPEVAAQDIRHLEEVLAGAPLALTFYHPPGAAEHQVRFKLYQPHTAPVLSEVLPKLENMGFRAISEIPYRVEAEGGHGAVWIGDFELETRGHEAIDLSAVGGALRELFADVWVGRRENDGFNRLVLRTGLTGRQVVVLRAYAKYLRQAGLAFSQRFVERTLTRHGDLAKGLVELFEARFDPELFDSGQEGDRKSRQKQLRKRLLAGFDGIQKLDEDLILRRFLNLILSTLRTTYYQQREVVLEGESAATPSLAFKLDSQRVQDLPLPRPRYEIFVYSPRFEGVHLRGGLVARGGLRWSDRREDFRTEILDLVKAQSVKNAVIVPVGAKGGFVLKRPPQEGGRQALGAEGLACYRLFIRALLDLTDNLRGDELVPPPGVVRHDGDDPYLVVAADKGTATFSDHANAIAQEYGFWLGDAFASGGSAGYDHKKMGITAKGAWESVKRHFREAGLDTQSQRFTVVGVGDMSGDVFGNGMLQSRHIRLLAAFNHLHIFVDPDPDPEASFLERQRLFELPASSWADYSLAALSTGGRIYDRSEKSLELSDEIRSCFKISESSLTPARLIQYLLRAKVDLLWFGGIGTYVRASSQRNAEIGDRHNDALRVAANEVNCQVVGEGANLALTQRSRIELARSGVRINTDAIDNSAGVDCSDHEVNIKILLDGVVAQGDLTGKQRNALLEEMTDEVSRLVLRDNYLQTQAISIEHARGFSALDQQQQLLRHLERSVRLDRAIEDLPDDEGLEERRISGEGLSRPEISVLLAYAKLDLSAEILASDLPDEDLLGEELRAYFPRPLQERFAEAIEGHRLRREIITTALSNHLVNRVGPTFLHRLSEATGVAAPGIARAFTAARKVFDLRELWTAVEALDGEIPAKVQIGIMLDIGRTLERMVLWFLQHRGAELEIGATVKALEGGIAEVRQNLAEVLPGRRRQIVTKRTNRLTKQGVPETLARRLASLDFLVAGLDIVDLSDGSDVATVSPVYFQVGETFGLDWLHAQARDIDLEGGWTHLAVVSLQEDLYSHQRRITRRVLEEFGGDARPVQRWVQEHRTLFQRARRLLDDLKATPSRDFEMLTVANHQLRGLARS
ncbi:MAG: NAD-glutamate dehydrogenase [Acidobacteriota bacterium]